MSANQMSSLQGRCGRNQGARWILSLEIILRLTTPSISWWPTFENFKKKIANQHDYAIISEISGPLIGKVNKTKGIYNCSKYLNYLERHMRFCQDHSQNISKPKPESHKITINIV